MTAWSSQGDYKVLYANLSDKDGGAVIAQLSQMNVPYQFVRRRRARSWCRPAQVHDLRLKLATAGLPKGAVSGFELMDSARFGQTQFQERLTFQRGLEGELTRSISSLAAVQSGARAPGAAEPERLLPRAAEAQRLGAADAAPRPHARPRAGRRHRPPGRRRSVPELEPEGGQRARPDRRAAHRRAATRPAPASTRSSCSTSTRSRPATPSASSSCSSRSSAATTCAPRVTADIDFSQTEATSEEFKPNQGADASVSIRSQQTTEQGGAAGGAPPSGVPGAASNQPPIAGDRADHRRLAAAAGRADRRRRRQRRPARGGHQLRGRQDRARDAQRHRQRASASTPPSSSTTAASPTPRARRRRCR